MPTVAFQTLGCKVNQYETDSMWQLFKQAGYTQVPFDQKADVYVINTCTVTNTGDRKSRQMIRRAVRRNPDAVIVVTGCYAQTSPAEVMAIPGVDIVLGTQGRDKLLEYVRQFQEERQPINAVTDIMKAREFEEFDVPTVTEHHRANLKIQEGCNNFCTFCIIPWARGLLRSRSPESVLKQARQLVAAGYREIVLTGIHTAGYGEDLENYSFAQLLRDLDAIEGLQRIRISSIEASQITDEVLEVFHRSDKLCRHLHVPLQAGDDTILRRMRRKYTVEQYREKIEAVRAALPGLAVTTDVIVGFPGETEEQFMNGYRFIEEIGFARLHVFPYSKRSGTPAAKMPDQVPEEVKRNRVERLLSLSERLSLDYARQFTGQVLEVIPEQPWKSGPESGWVMGRADNYLQLAFRGTPDMFGKLVRVRLDEPGADVNRGTFLRLVG